MSNVDTKQLGLRIAAKRKELDLSQAELAHRLDISVPHMSNIETGKKTPGIDILKQLSNVLHVTADWLLQTDEGRHSDDANKEIQELASSLSASEQQFIKDIINDFIKYKHRM